MTVNEVQELFCCCCHFFYCLCFLNTSHRPVVSVPNAVNNTKSIELLSNISLRALKSDAFVSIDTCTDMDTSAHLSSEVDLKMLIELLKIALKK